MSPERSDLVLTTNIPYGKGDVLVFDGLDVEAYRWRISNRLPVVVNNARLTNGGNGGDNFAQLEFIENGCLTRCIKTDLCNPSQSAHKKHLAIVSYHQNSYTRTKEKVIVSFLSYLTSWQTTRTHLLLAK
jgi:hypothetical protein